MRRFVWFWMTCLMLGITVGIAGAQQPETTAAQGVPQVTSFSSPVNGVSRDDLANRTARVPVSWTTENRPLTANLVFDQVLPDGGVINVELPRLLPWVVPSGQGIAAPILPSADATQILLRVRMINLITGAVLSERQLTLPIVEGGSSGSIGDRAAITSFTTPSTYVSADQLANGTVLLPVSWDSANRPVTANFVFEQLLGDGSAVNVELPRSNPFVNSSGNGAVAPVQPGGSPTSITLRVSLFDLISGRVYDVRELSLPILPAGTLPTPTPLPQGSYINFYRVDAQTIEWTTLASGNLRIPVSWEVANRPPNSNLVFEEVLSGGQVINIELPRPDPIVGSSGNGLIAPVDPGDNATSVQFLLSLVGTDNKQLYDRETVTVPIVRSSTVTPSPTPTAQPFALTFSTTINTISRETLASGSARIPVSWSVSPRPNETNLYFEQVFADGSAFNVELPRTTPIVSSAGNGVVAPILPADGSANQIVLRVRLANLASPGVALIQRQLIIPLTGTVTATSQPQRFYLFTPSTVVIDASQFVNGSIIIPISWDVSPRPNDTNLVFQQVFPDGRVVNAELPRPNPIVPSSGTGAVQLQDAGVDEVRVRVLLAALNGVQVFNQSEIVIPVNRNVPAVSAQSAEPTTVPTDAEAQSACGSTWFVANASGCASAPAVQVPVTIQQFERGLTLVIADTSQVLFLTDEGTVIANPSGAVDSIPEAPEGLFAPSTPFQMLWANNQERVGWATSPEGSYLATLQTSSQEAYLTLPDGRIARLELVDGVAARWNVAG